MAHAILPKCRGFDENPVLLLFLRCRRRLQAWCQGHLLCCLLPAPLRLRTLRLMLHRRRRRRSLRSCMRQGQRWLHTVWWNGLKPSRSWSNSLVLLPRCCIFPSVSEMKRGGWLGWRGCSGWHDGVTWLMGVVGLMVVSSLLMLMMSWSSPFGLWMVKWSAMAHVRMRISCEKVWFSCS